MRFFGVMPLVPTVLPMSTFILIVVIVIQMSPRLTFVTWARLVVIPRILLFMPMATIFLLIIRPFITIGSIFVMSLRL